MSGFDQSPSANEPADVGATQRGFYGEQYRSEDRSSTVAGSAAGYEPPTGAYDAPGGDSRESATNPSTNGWGGPAPSSGLSASESADRPPSSSPYQQIRDGLRDDWRNTTSAVSGSATQMTQQAQDFVQGSSAELQQGVDSIRDGIRNQYQEFSQGVTGTVDQGRQDPANRFQDYGRAVEPDTTRAADTASSWDSSNPAEPATRSGTNSEGAYPTTSQPNLPGNGTALNPPSAEQNTGPSAFDGYSTEPAGARSNEPWRPGSTSDYPQTPAAPNGASSGMGPRPYVEPASYDSWETDAAPAPTHGWSSQSQRLSPTYR